MPSVPSPNHEEREKAVIDDLEAHFPDFTGAIRIWTTVPAGQDPPDLIGVGADGRLGLELTEWLDGAQMSAAKWGESLRNQAHRVLAKDWKLEYQPKNIRGAFLILGNKRIERNDEGPLRREFYAHAMELDAAWHSHPDRSGDVLYVAEFPGYPLMGKYLNVRYFGGEPVGLCWIHPDGGGGAYDPSESARALTAVIEKKLVDYSTSEKQRHLQTHRLGELSLLVHGGFNAYAYNSPTAPLSLEDIARHCAEWYAAHSQRNTFDRVWFFDSLNSADEFNQLIGVPAREGRVRWLAQLWPEFRLY